MKIELLYFAECPYHKQARELVERVIREAGITAAVTLISVETEAAARRQRFPGSPTIRINGKDVEDLGPLETQDFGLGCRVYLKDGKPAGLPSAGAVREALRRAQAA